jgi:hypothetical protein
MASNINQEGFFYFKDKYPECDNNILSEIGLIKFSKKKYDIDQINANIRYFDESLAKAKDELKYLENTFHIDKVKHWKNDVNYREYILRKRKANANEERVPTFINGTLNKDLTNEEYINYYITMLLATNLKRMEQLREHIDYYTTALNVLKNDDFHMATLK